MSFLNTFIEWSILAEQEKQSEQLYYQTKLLEEQNESINSIIEHQKEQDWIRDYLYRINKCCIYLEKSKDNKSLDYYYSIYCLAKGINESGLSAKNISELQDKEYFDKCLEKISRLMWDFAKNNKEKISIYNNHIQNIEEEPIFNELKKSELARYDIVKTKERIQTINDTIKDYKTEMIKKHFKILLCFIPTACISTILAYLKFKYNFYIIKTIEDYGYYVICGLISLMGLLFASVIGNYWTKKSIKKRNIKITSADYYSFNQEKKQCYKNIYKYTSFISKKNIIYEYAYDTFPDLDFSDENYSKNYENIHSRILEKEKEIQNSINLLKTSPDKIYENFYIYE